MHLGPFGQTSEFVQILEFSQNYPQIEAFSRQIRYDSNICSDMNSGGNRMAKNTGDGFRKGEIRDRSQFLNPATDQWTKRDAETGEFIAAKEDGERFKGVRREKK